MPFFKRIKKAITDFEFYADFASEKISVAIKYYSKIIIIFALIISIAFSYKFSTVINNEEQLQIMYNQMEENGIDMQMIQDEINYIRSNNSLQFYVSLALSMTMYMFLVYFILGFVDILLLSILGMIVSRISKVVLKYKAILIMSIYSLTLPIILNCIYIVVNTLTGFTIEYFSIVYNIIAYIYIITAILMIRTFFIENRQELMQIVNEQRKVRIEQREKEEQEDDKNDEEQEDEASKEDEGKQEDGGSPIKT